MPPFPTLRRKVDFDALSQAGRSRSCRLLVMWSRRSGGAVTRVGLSTPRSIRGAVVRNRLRRRLREAVRSAYGELRPGYDLLIAARATAAEASVAELSRAVADLARRSGVAW